MLSEFDRSRRSPDGTSSGTPALGETGSAPGENADEVIADAVESLVGDWRRKSTLEIADVTRVAVKRRLSLEQLHAVLKALKADGIVASETNQAEPVSEATVNSEERPNRPYLTREEEKQLANSMRVAAQIQETGASDPKDFALIEHGQRARDEFITRNLKLVYWVARKWNGPLDQDDIVQEGMKGLIKAVEMFDPDLGYKFSTYATWWIEQAIHRGIDNTANEIRMPVHRLEEIRRLRRMVRRLRSEKRADPSVGQLAAALDWSLEKTAFIADLATYRTVEIDAPLHPNSQISIKDGLADLKIPSPEEHVMRAALQTLLNRLVTELPHRTRDVIRQRFGLGTGRERTLEEIGRDYGMTRERIRQIEAQGLTKLRHPKRLKVLKPFRE